MEIGWLYLQYRRDFHPKCIMIFKCRNGLAPQYLCDLFNSNGSVHSCNTRNSSQLRATKSCTAYYHHSFTVSGLNLWNSFLEISKKVLLCQVLKVQYLSLLLLLKPQF